MGSRSKALAPKRREQRLSDGLLEATEYFIRADQKTKTTAADRNKAKKLLLKGTKCVKRNDLEGAAKCYFEAHVCDPTYNEPLLFLANTLAEIDRASEAILAFERLLKLNPDDPEMIFGIGCLADKLKMHDAAVSMYSTFIQMKPDDFRGYYNLAYTYYAMERFDEAIELLQYAIQGLPSSAELWQVLGIIVADAHDIDTARPFFEEAIRLNPGYSDAYANYGRALNAVGRYAESVPILEKAVSLAGDKEPESHFNLSTALIGVGRLKEGWEKYEWRLDARRSDSVTYLHNLPRWQGEDLSGKTILICDEQGIGDTVLFASCFQELIDRAGHTIIEVDRRLIPLFMRSFPGCTVMPTIQYVFNGRVHQAYPWIKDFNHPIDYAIEAGSLLKFFRSSIEDFPTERHEGYLKPDPDRVAFWRERFDRVGDGLKVGLCWSGGMIDHTRKQIYVNLEDFLPFLQLEGADFINVMYKDCREEIALMKDRHGFTVHDWEDIDRRDNLDDNAAYMAALDVVISISSFPAEAAASLNKPTFLLWAGPGSMQCGTGDRYPFHPNVTLFINGDDEQEPWPKKAVREAAQALQQRIGAGR